MNRLMKGETVDTEIQELGNVWICKKCQLIRSSKVTHIHGVPLPYNLLMKLSGDEKKKTEK